MGLAEQYFSESNRKVVTDSIAEAEKQTSGEIRLFIEDTCDENVLDRAAYIFLQLKTHETEGRNGVLFYLAMQSRKFAILGDAGINSKVPKDFWHDIKLEMQHHFTEGDFTKGLSKGIIMAGEALKKYFPHMDNDVNEISDEIVFGTKRII